MASLAHQFIVSCIARRIRKEGYEIVAYDGNWMQIGQIKIKIPPTVLRHKPDIVAINLHNGNLSIGEAKTKNDITKSRTKEQIIDFITNSDIKLFIGIPKSSKPHLINILKNIGVMDELEKQIIIITVPEELFPNE